MLSGWQLYILLYLHTELICNKLLLESYSLFGYMLLPAPYNQIIGLSLIRFMCVRWKRDSERKREKESEVNNERKKEREREGKEEDRSVIMIC